MENVAGIRIEHLDFSPIKRGDLLYHEGPLLAHFTDRNNPANHYLYKWADADATANRWIVVKVSADDLLHFLHQRLSLRQLLSDSAFVYVLDLDNDFSTKQVMLVSTRHLPVEYLPGEQSFFNAAQYEPYAIKLKEYLNTPTNQEIPQSILDELHLLRLQQDEMAQILNTLKAGKPRRVTLIRKKQIADRFSKELEVKFSYPEKTGRRTPAQ